MQNFNVAEAWQDILYENLKKDCNKLWPKTENKNEAINKSGNEEILNLCQGIPSAENTSIGEVSEWCGIDKSDGGFEILHDEELVLNAIQDEKCLSEDEKDDILKDCPKIMR